MLLKSDQAIRLHRAEKRHLEISKVIDAIQYRCSADKNESSRVLEFGCGNGFQIPYLSQLGSVIATDIYTSDELRVCANGSFCESSIYELPFSENSFDIIFSNHVVEHLHEPARAFSELNRVGRSDCLFAFTVPTNYWLLLALPSKYLGKIIEAWGMIHSRFTGSKKSHEGSDFQQRMSVEKRLQESDSQHRGFFSLLLPKGHGVYPEYGKCLKAFTVKSWGTFFQDHGFCIQEVVPLLLYGPSERPVIPTTARFNQSGICSSVLFLLTVDCRKD